MWRDVVVAVVMIYIGILLVVIIAAVLGANIGPLL